MSLLAITHTRDTINVAMSSRLGWRRPSHAWRGSRRYGLAAVQDVLREYLDRGTLSYLENPKNGAELYLVGTAHVSAKSSEEVKEVIHVVKPNLVAVELCEQRAKKLLAGEPDTQGLFQKIQEFIKIPGGFSQKIIHFAMKSFYQALREAGLEPGKEFKVAMEEAKKIGAGIVLIDQPSDVTIAKLSNAITFHDVLNLFRRPPTEMEECMGIVESLSDGDLSERIEKMKRREAVRQLMKFMESTFPSLVKVILHERDELMTEKLLECEGKVVGVVGMGHMDGIEQRWKEKIR